MTQYYIDLGVVQKLADAASSVINGTRGIIEGCRLISGLSHHISDDPDYCMKEVFLFFIGTASEMDDYPLGELRKKYKKEYLEELDLEANSYIGEIREDVK